MTNISSDRLFPETVEERLGGVRARLVRDVEKADEAIDRAQAKKVEAQRLLDEYDAGMEQYREETKDMLVKPRIDWNTGEVID